MKRATSESNQTSFRLGFVLAASAALAIFALLLSIGRFSISEGRAAGNRLVVVSYGGTFQDGLRAGYFKPFASSQNVDLVEDSGPNVAKIKAMVEAKAVQWDAVQVTSADYEVLSKQNLLEKVDYGAFDKATLQQLPDFVKLEYGVGTTLYACGITYRTDLGKTDHPTSWAEFWDTKKFPGPRAMPTGTYAIPPWEAALMADGVPSDKIYPIDFKRALSSLDKIKSSVKVWYEDTAAGTQALVNGEVDYGFLCTNRVQAAKKGGAKVEVEWNQALFNYDVWVVPKGAPNIKTAMQFLAFVSTPGPEAEVTKLQPVGPVNPEAIKLLGPEYANSLPSSPEIMKVEVRINSAFYGESVPEGGTQQDRGLKLWNTWYGK
jgi:putative spermidine/putrescine transport system substrate-binding protein